MPTRDTAIDTPSTVAEGVSVVVPTCNRREQIVRCVRSLLKQTSPPREIIVVDDGSTDGSADAIRALSTDVGPTNLRVICNDRTLGANASRNVGIRVAAGALVAFLDSDCVADAQWIERLREPFADPLVGAASGIVEDTCRSTAWERAFAGTHRLPRRGPARRAAPEWHFGRGALRARGAP